MQLIESTNLWYQDSRSDKVYYAELIKIPSTNCWNINFAYGRRGNTLVHGQKNERPVSYPEAKKIYSKLVESKVKKGYDYTTRDWTEINRTRTYSSFASNLLNEKYITQDEYESITRMLYSNDPETVKLAEVLIETKENQRWVQN
jgi:predicted DNA-binding WGR domain protein